MEVRLARPEDLPVLMTLRLETLRELQRLPGDHAFDPDFLCATKRALCAPTTLAALTWDGDTPVACAMLCGVFWLPTPDHPTGLRGHLMGVYTRPEWRRRGVAQGVVSLLIEEGRKRGMTEISLDATEEGRRLYRALGFRDNAEGMVLMLRQE